MTVSSSTNKDTYSGNGSTTVFAYTFRILAQGEILVQLKDAAGTITTQTITTDYTVSNVGASSGGNITMVTAPASGETLILTRDMPFTQEIDYLENDTFPAETHEEGLDRRVMEIQQLQEEVGRGLKYDASVSGVSSTMPDPTAGAGKFLRYKSDGLEIEAAALSSTAGITEVFDDPSPELGGDLDMNAFDIISRSGHGIEDDARNELITFSKTSTAVNEFTVANAATGDGPTLSATGDDTNIDVNITPKGTGAVKLDGLAYPTADGTNGQALTTNGSGTIAFSTIDTGAMVLLSSATASSSASIDFTGLSSTYIAYQIIFDSYVPSTDTTELQLRVSTDGGSSYVATNSYRHAGHIVDESGTESAGGSNSDTNIALQSGCGTGSSETTHGIITIYNPSSTAGFTHVDARISQYSSTPTYRVNYSGGIYAAQTAVNAVQLLSSSGNMASGTFKLYGITAA